MSDHRSQRDARGLISLCPHAGCAYRCCDFQRGNFIATYPGELEQARARGVSTAHLEVLADDPHGGQRVKCVAGDTATCDGGYKPLDCASYPFFPTEIDDRGRVAGLIKGEKCPLVIDDVREHVRWATAEWEALARNAPVVRQWLSSVEMVGYVSVPTVRVALVLGYQDYGTTPSLIRAARARGLCPVLVGDELVDRQPGLLAETRCFASNDALHDPRALAQRVRLELPQQFEGYHAQVVAVLNRQDYMWPLYLELTRAFPGSATVAPSLIELTALKPNFRHRLRGTRFDVDYSVVPIADAATHIATTAIPGHELIVKPVAGGGSFGVTKVKNRSDPVGVALALDAVRDANMRYGTGDRVRARLLDLGENEVAIADYVLLEAFVEGDEYSVEGHADADGRIETIVVSRKTDSREQPFRDLEYVHDPNDPRRGRIEESARDLLRLLEFRGQTFHLELKIDADGACKPIELNPRPGGGSICDFVRAITGVDLAEKSLYDLLTCVGEPPAMVLRVVQPEGVAPGAYTLDTCEGVDGVVRDDSCVYAHRYEHDGAEIRAGSREYYLVELGATAPTEAEAIKRARALAGRVKPNLTRKPDTEG